ncbi:hypothetical protein TNCV_4083841 [Trichonephila clavipes]|nr:hypothetical protein TNCV_4083841 [Trichonephila clavipes]
MAVGSLVVRAPDRKAWVRCPYHQIPSEYTRSRFSLNQWVRQSCGLNHECRELEKISLPFSSTPKLWRWRYMVAPSIVMFYGAFGNFNEINRTVTCMVFKAKANDRCTSSHCYDEFRGSRSDYVRQKA